MKKYILPLIIAFLSVHLLAQDKNQFNPCLLYTSDAADEL